MKSRQKTTFCLSMIILLGTVLLFSTSCVLPLTLEVENQTDQTISTYVWGVWNFDVPPNTTVTQDSTIASEIADNFFIEGLNQQGGIVYSRILDHGLVTKHWRFLSTYYLLKIIITPSDDNPYLPLEIRNNTDDDLEIYINDVFVFWIERGETVIKKPLPPNLAQYKIDAVAFKKRHISPEPIYSRAFTGIDLEKLDWKIAIQ